MSGFEPLAWPCCLHAFSYFGIVEASMLWWRHGIVGRPPLRLLVLLKTGLVSHDRRIQV